MPSRLLSLFRHPSVWWTVVAGLALTGLLSWELHREAEELDRQRLAMRVAEVTGQLDARIEKSEMLLHSLRDYLMLSGESRATVVDRWCYENGLSINCPWVHAVLVATNRNRVRWREPLPDTPAPWPAETLEALRVLAVQNPITCEIAMATSLTNTKRYLTDYGLSGDVLSRNWFSVTVMNSRLGMSRRQTVMMDAASNAIPGTLFVVPLYDPALTEATARLISPTNPRPAEIVFMRWVQLTGLIVAPVDFNMLARSVWDGAPADLGIELFSSTNQTAETWLNGSATGPRAADPNFKPYLSQRRHWPMYGLGFSIFYYTTPLFEAQSPRRLARVATGAGLVLTLLAALLVGVAVRSRSRQDRMTRQIREARDALATAQRERNKISRDLHDGTIQSLYAIQLGLGQTAERFQASPVQAGSELEAVRRDLDAVIAEIRQFITVEAGAEKAVDFAAVLQTLVQRARSGSEAQIIVECDPAASARLTGGHAVQLANVVREALSNSLRHAQPQRVKISMGLDAGQVVLVVEDDGVGFDPKAPRRAGVGLASLAARTEEMGGALEIESAPGRGTRIAVRVPALGVESERADPAVEPGDES